MLISLGLVSIMNYGAIKSVKHYRHFRLQFISYSAWFPKMPELCLFLFGLRFCLYCFYFGLPLSPKCQAAQEGSGMPVFHHRERNGVLGCLARTPQRRQPHRYMLMKTAESIFLPSSPQRDTYTRLYFCTCEDLPLTTLSPRSCT